MLQQPSFLSAEIDHLAIELKQLFDKYPSLDEVLMLYIFKNITGKNLADANNDLFEIANRKIDTNSKAAAVAFAGFILNEDDVTPRHISILSKTFDKTQITDLVSFVFDIADNLDNKKLKKILLAVETAFKN
jgi:hypothetical protein